MSDESQVTTKHRFLCPWHHQLEIWSPLYKRQSKPETSGENQEPGRELRKLWETETWDTGIRCQMERGTQETASLLKEGQATKGCWQQEKLPSPRQETPTSYPLPSGQPWSHTHTRSPKWTEQGIFRNIPTFLMLPLFNTVPHVVVTSHHKVNFIAPS